jgi:hypothetical protein
MLRTYSINGEEVDSLELKILLITKGINISSDEVYERFGNTHRISSFKDPGACNCLLLPDNTVIHMWNAGSRSPFTIGIAESSNAYLAYDGHFVTEVGFPPKTQFYKQYTSKGVPFGMIAVLQGLDVLSFPYLWPCEYAKSGFPCQFCYTGAYTEELAREGKLEFLSPAPQDVAEVVNYAVNTEKLASYIQITGGSTMTPHAECHLVCEMLRAIDELADLDKISGEILVYSSPPSDSVIVDEVFQAGADRVACDMEIWDEELFKRICPGKARFAGRERQLNALVHIAERHGRNKACSAFVIGLEPVESFLSGAEYLASHGIVPLPSIWMPMGKTVLGLTEAPGLSYYRQVKDGLAEIYERYQCEPPGSTGFNVCLCRDTWNNRNEILRRKKYPNEGT